MNPRGPMTDVVERSLEHLPTRISRLVYLSSLYDPYTGRYLHEGWIGAASPDEIHQVMRRKHLQAFENVLELPLQSLCEELTEHFSSLPGSVTETARLWLDTEPFREMIPAGSSPVGRDLLVSQIRTALKVLVRAGSG